MNRPVIVATDDDELVAEALGRDLRSRYAEDYQIVLATSGPETLTTLEQLCADGERTALLISDHQMPGMSGVDLLTASRSIFPTAKRVLLTAYADTQAAITAINEADIDHYLLKPWVPAADRLYPVVDELLEDWQASNPPPFSGVRLVGLRWSSASHELRDLFARNQVPYRWLEADSDPEALALLARTGTRPEQIPLVALEDGTVLRAPSKVEVLSALGVTTRPEQTFYDLAVVGGGPAGLAAGVYGAAEGLRTILIERLAPGGQAGQSSLISNYLGFPHGISGSELARRATAQVRALGTEVLGGHEVAGLRLEDPARCVVLDDGSEVSAHAVIVATGVSYNIFEAEGAGGLTGSGVYYGAVAIDTEQCRGADVYLVGGANSAGQAAVHFAKVARSVTLVVRNDSITSSMSAYLVKQLERMTNVFVRTNSVVRRVEGLDHLERIFVVDQMTGKEEVLDTSWLFVFIGGTPRSEWVGPDVVRDDHGFIITGRELLTHPRASWPLEREPLPLETNVPGVFAAGDVRHDSLKRVVTAVAEGGMAVQMVWRYLDLRK